MLIDPDRLVGTAEEERNPYFIEVKGNRIYGSSPTAVVEKAKRELQPENKNEGAAVTKQKQLSIQDSPNQLVVKSSTPPPSNPYALYNTNINSPPTSKIGVQGQTPPPSNPYALYDNSNMNAPPNNKITTRGVSRQDTSAEYALLGLAPGATAVQVAQAYRKKALVAHPNKGGDPAQFKKLTDARDTILKLMAQTGGRRKSLRRTRAQAKRQQAKRQQAKRQQAKHKKHLATRKKLKRRV